MALFLSFRSIRPHSGGRRLEKQNQPHPAKSIYAKLANGIRATFRDTLAENGNFENFNAATKSMKREKISSSNTRKQRAALKRGV